MYCQLCHTTATPGHKALPNLDLQSTSHCSPSPCTLGPFPKKLYSESVASFLPFLPAGTDAWSIHKGSCQYGYIW
jgi:hypothetical protein